MKLNATDADTDDSVGRRAISNPAVFSSVTSAVGVSVLCFAPVTCKCLDVNGIRVVRS